MQTRPAKQGLAPHWGALFCVLAASAYLSSCYGTARCGAESCDDLDNDCDGLVDEDFADVQGVFSRGDHCGSCNVVCDDVFPTATQTACIRGDEGSSTYRCEAQGCRLGEELRGGVCVPATSALCAPCNADAECDALDPGSQCVAGNHCGRPCSLGDPASCPPDFVCASQAGRSPTAEQSSTAFDLLRTTQCIPTTGSCECRQELVGLSVPCVIETTAGQFCSGERLCQVGGFGPCTPALDEVCNALDDDCDGNADEGFVDDIGRYVSSTHCGECNAPCVAAGAHMVATCVAPLESGAAPSCLTECEDGFVDVDGVAATGCECGVLSGEGPVIGGDADCDGAIDATPDLIFVAPQGNDANDGEDVSRPVRTLARGSVLGSITGRSVVVARGIYQGPLNLVAGVTLLGGYSPDFHARDPERYPALIERGTTGFGEPIVRCTDIAEPTRIEGFTVLGTDAIVRGSGSTALYLDRCSSDVVLSRITVLAGRGATGEPGATASERLGEWGLISLTQLSGIDGAPGHDGSFEGDGCSLIAPGAGGSKVCRRDSQTPGGLEVSGGNGAPSSCTNLASLCDNASDAGCGNAGCTDFTTGDVCDFEAVLDAAVPGLPAEAGSGPQAGEPGVRSFAAPTNRDTCTFCDDNPTLPREGGDGTDGGRGEHGQRGLGCSVEEGIGAFDVTTGRLRAGGGESGSDGTDGSGGGGATAGAGFSVIANTLGGCGNIAGGSGGGGGSGGCGAPGGNGGGGGGASIGIAIRVRSPGAAGPSLDRVRIVTGSGGDGGDGGIGATGGTGGSGGNGGLAHFFCARNGGRGGDGGNGGAGGGAGGGCGGGSFGLVIAGQTSDEYEATLATGLVVERTGVPGQAGLGGFSPGSSGESGLPGPAQDWLVVEP